MLRAILNKSWRQHPTKHQWTRPAGHWWRSRDELINDVLLWTPTYGRAKAGRPARTYIQLLCDDTGCSPEDQPEAMNDRDKWQERVRDIHAGGSTWWWWWWWSLHSFCFCFFCVNIYFVALGFVGFRFSVFCFSIRLEDSHFSVFNI